MAAAPTGGGIAVCYRVVSMPAGTRAVPALFTLCMRSVECADAVAGNLQLNLCNMLMWAHGSPYVVLAMAHCRRL